MRRSLGLLGLASMALVGCVSATETVTGETPLLVDPCQTGGVNAGNRWQDLYACYFGPSGQASCGSRNGCHGAPDQLGARASSFVCGPTAEACWRGMTAGIVPAGGTPDGSPVTAKQTVLYGTLRKSDGSGLMPLNSPYVFQPADLARIADWLEHGAQNN
jgi:hypothetical protein